MFGGIKKSCTFAFASDKESGYTKQEFFEKF